MTVQNEGTRTVERKLAYYNLDMILAIGYRVRSPRGIQFRKYASTVLKDYLIKGFAIDDERLKELGGGSYFIVKCWTYFLLLLIIIRYP